MSRKNNEPRDSAGNSIETTGNPIAESGNCYILMRGEQKPKRITNFTMRPVNAIQGDCSHLLDIEFKLKSGRVFIQQLDSQAFSGVQQFKKAIKKISGIDMVYDGNESNLADIQEFMNNKYRDYNHCLGINFTGLYKLGSDWAYVGTENAIDKKGNKIDSIVSITEDNEALKSTITDTDMITGKELKEIAGDLFRFNTYERTINIIGWVCVCFLKERLRQRKIKLSHLVLEGGAGSGKSETLEKIIQPIFGLVGSGIGCSGLTKFSTLKSTSSTNLLPVIFEEYKPHRLSKIELDLISGTLRSVYDFQTSQRGRTDQSVVNYMRRSPIIVVGESSFDETAIKERIIDVQFAKSDRMQEHTKHFRSLAKNEKILNKLGKALLMFTMNIPDSDLDVLIAKSKIFDDLDFESRVILGMSNINLGLNFLQDLFESYHLDFYESTGISGELVKRSLIGNTTNALDGNSKVNSAVDLILQVFDTMALKNRIHDGRDYIIKECELCLRINLIYDEFSKYVREYDITDIEKLSNRQFTKQLRKEPYYKDYLVRNFKDGNDTIIRQKCYVLDLKILNQVCNLEAFKMEDSDFMELDENEEVPFQ